MSEFNYLDWMIVSTSQKFRTLRAHLVSLVLVVGGPALCVVVKLTFSNEPTNPCTDYMCSPEMIQTIARVDHSLEQGAWLMAVLVGITTATALLSVLFLRNSTDSGNWPMKVETLYFRYAMLSATLTLCVALALLVNMLTTPAI